MFFQRVKNLNEINGWTAQSDRLLASVVGVGVETATVIVCEVFSRPFKDRRALAGFVGLTGTPYDSGGSKTEQGISKNGNPRVRRMLEPNVMLDTRTAQLLATERGTLARQLAGARGTLQRLAELCQVTAAPVSAMLLGTVGELDHLEQVVRHQLQQVERAS